jgi:hypothetical protein
MDSNACRVGEVEREVWRDNDSLLRGQLPKTSLLVVGSPPCQPSESARERRRVATGIGATALRTGPDDARPIAFVALRSRLHPSSMPTLPLSG